MSNYKWYLPTAASASFCVYGFSLRTFNLLLQLIFIFYIKYLKKKFFFNKHHVGMKFIKVIYLKTNIKFKIIISK